jgi:hypothetical protein
MGHQDKARKVIQLTLLTCIAIAPILFFIPDSLTRIVGLGIEAAFYMIFPSIQDREFGEWEATHA